MEKILKDEKHGNLRNHRPHRGKWDLPCAHSKAFGQWVEEPYLESKGELGEVIGVGKHGQWAVQP